MKLLRIHDGSPLAIEVVTPDTQPSLPSAAEFKLIVVVVVAAVPLQVLALSAAIARAEKSRVSSSSSLSRPNRLQAALLTARLSEQVKTSALRR